MAADYINSPQDGVIRRWDMKFIARDPADENWQAYLAYAGNGGVLDDYLEVQQLTLQQRVIAGVQKRLDDFALSRGYDDIKSAVDYAGDEDAEFDKEGTYCKRMRSRHWRTCYQILGEVEAGVRSMPTFEDVMAQMPLLEWPA